MNNWFAFCTGLICVTPTLSLSLRRAVEEKIPEQEIVADMLELARAADVKVACPLSDTFCLPRVKCPIKSIVYDREGTRFMVGAEVNCYHIYVYDLVV